MNRFIRAPEVRVVGENITAGIYPVAEALRMAEEAGLDLVEISPDGKPPVCKIVNYQKFLYEKKRKEKEIKAKSSKAITKEIRFGPHTDEHDFNFKVKHAMKFLQDGAKVKAFVHFRGRQLAYKEQGEILLLRLAQELESYGKVEMFPKLEGNRMFLHMVPLPKKKG